MMNDELQAFFENPSLDNFRRAWGQIVVDPGYEPYSPAMGRLTALNGEGRFDEMLAKVDEMMPAWALSPRAHFLAACAADRLGDEEEVELRQFLMQACLVGLLNTGDGTRKNPYLVTHITDERDILDALGCRARGQSLIVQDARCFDVIACEDGSEVWFEVTELVRRAPVPAATQAAAAPR